MSGRRWGRAAYAIDAPELAQSLLGQRLVHVLPSGERLSGIIVETEAYIGPDDLASHARRGLRTARNESMYACPGTVYVYFTYGMHHCFNVVCGAAGVPHAVLVRALEPESGVESMRRLRALNGRAPAVLRDRQLCSGPARLCAAMAIDRSHDGTDLVSGGALFIETARTRRHRPGEVINTARIGVGYAGEWANAPLRWALSANEHVSGARSKLKAVGGSGTITLTRSRELSALK